MKRYVTGFLFDSVGLQVALIEKLRPEWQKFQLNGIGGKIEFGESPKAAMRREFREETGVDIDRWKEYVSLSGPDSDYIVHFYHAYGDELSKVQSITDEIVDIYEVSRIVDPNMCYPVIPNLRWLIPMALSLVYESDASRIKYSVTRDLLLSASQIDLLLPENLNV